MKLCLRINLPPLFIAMLTQNIEIFKLLLTNQDLDINAKRIV